jgi:hypothetical protein
MTPHGLKETLITLGWQIGPEHSNTGVDWYAYQKLDGAADCTSNEKPPGICITPWNLGAIHSVEFSVTGAVAGEEWLSLKIYSVSMDKAVEMIPRAAAILLAAWNAASAIAPANLV